MVLKTNTDNYMEYLKTYRQAFNSNIPTEEKEAIINQAYSKYKQQEVELYDILDHAYLDFIA